MAKMSFPPRNSTSSYSYSCLIVAIESISAIIALMAVLTPTSVKTLIALGAVITVLQAEACILHHQLRRSP